MSTDRRDFMHSFLIAGKDTTVTYAYAQKLCKDVAIDILDITNIDKRAQLDKKQSTSIGIEDVRTILHKLFLKPIKSESKAIIIHNSQDLTIDAQNALLKSLEEPPQNTIIILLATSKDMLLATICSRCAIIELAGKKLEIENETKEFATLITKLPSLPIGERLKLAQDHSKSKDDALLWLEKITLAARTTLLEESMGEQTGKYLNLLQQLLSTYKDVKTTNVSPRLALEQCLLSY